MVLISNSQTRFLLMDRPSSRPHAHCTARRPPRNLITESVLAVPTLVHHPHLRVGRRERGVQGPEADDDRKAQAYARAHSRANHGAGGALVVVAAFALSSSSLSTPSLSSSSSISSTSSHLFLTSLGSDNIQSVYPRWPARTYPVDNPGYSSCCRGWEVDGLGAQTCSSYLSDARKRQRTSGAIAQARNEGIFGPV